MDARRFAALAVAFTALVAASAEGVEAVRIKDLGRVSGWRENALVGYGLVTGLAGTGDSAGNKATRQSIANLLSQFNFAIAPDQIQSRNVATVIVTASLPPFARQGDAIDVTVTSLGDARSLVGGNLLLTPLKGPNNRIYALAQGSVTVGGYKYDMNGNVVQKNHPTVGSVPGGATIEVGTTAELVDAEGTVTFVLNSADYTTATRVADSLNRTFAAPLAQARDAAGIQILVPPDQRDRLAAFLTRVENVSIEPDRRARVVINERTGTVVAGGDVRISPVSISHGDLKVSIVTENTVSQPIFVRQAGPGVRTEVVANTRVDVEEKGETGFVAATSNTVAELVHSLTRIKTSTRDIISILRAIKAAGALHAELVVQ
jgi:flagellar P-ring protein precursor FlgI